MSLKFVAPSRDTPGFLRRARKGLYFAEQVEKGLTLEAFDEMIDFLLSFITEPKDRKLAREELEDASENQFMDMLAAVTGATGDAVPLASNEPSDNGGSLEQEAFLPGS